MSKIKYSLDEINSDEQLIEKIKNVDGAGSGLDADLLDGLDSSQFLRTDSSDSVNGDITFNGKISFPDKSIDDSTDDKIELIKIGNNGGLWQASNRGALIISSSDDTLVLANGEVGKTYKDEDWNDEGENINIFSDYRIVLVSNLQNGFNKDEHIYEFYDGDIKIDGKLVGLDENIVKNNNNATKMTSTATSPSAIGENGVEHWVTVASSVNGRRHGRVIVSDKFTGRHSFIEIDWMRSYGDSSFVVINKGGNTRVITGVRILRNQSDYVYGEYILQIRIDHLAIFTVSVISDYNNPGWDSPVAVEPVVEDTKTGFTMFRELTDIKTLGFGTSKGASFAGDIYSRGSLVWNKANHGTGSGLDADLLRGLPADFTNNLSSNGYQKLPGGLIIQWGLTTQYTYNVLALFPIVFPNACLSVAVTPTDEQYTASAFGVTANHFSLRTENITGGIYNTIPCYYIAIGH